MGICFLSLCCRACRRTACRSGLGNASILAREGVRRVSVLIGFVSAMTKMFELTEENFALKAAANDSSFALSAWFVSWAVWVSLAILTSNRRPTYTNTPACRLIIFENRRPRQITRVSTLKSRRRQCPAAPISAAAMNAPASELIIGRG